MDPITAVPTVAPTERMNCVAEVATPSMLRSTVLCTARFAVGMIQPSPKPVTARYSATVAWVELAPNVVSR
jgi:hypothetical protein